MTEDRALRKYARPATTAGQDLFERTSLAAGTLTAILRDRGMHEYNLRDWMPESGEIVAIELEAADAARTELASALTETEGCLLRECDHDDLADCVDSFRARASNTKPSSAGT